MKSRLVRWLAAGAVLIVGTVSVTVVNTALGASIGVNFGDGTFALAPGDSAGVIPQVNWQNITTSSAAAVTLFENTDSNTSAATTAALTFSGSVLPTIQTALAVDGPDEKLNNSRVASFSAPMTLSITGVPYDAYDVIAYVFTGSAGRRYSTTIGGTTLWGMTPASPTGPGYIDDNNLTPFNYTAAIGATSATATDGGNYYLFSGLSGGDLTITMNTSNDLATISALQIVEIVEIPEPSSALLLLVGCCALGLRHIRVRRRRRHADLGIGAQ